MTKYCNECKLFMYEDAGGYGVCHTTNEKCRCSDMCHLDYVSHNNRHYEKD